MSMTTTVSAGAGAGTGTGASVSADPAEQGSGHLRSERGSIAVELAILLPAFLALIVLAIVSGRQVIAQGAIDLAAHDAARTASLARTAEAAQPAAEAAAKNTLARQGLHYVQLTVTVDVRQFHTVPVGQPAFVRAEVTCEISFSDVAILGAPDHRILRASFTSPIDRYRMRT